MLAIVVGAVFAFLVPGAVLWMRPALQPAFAVTMLFVGTLVRPEQIRAFVAAPLRPVLGLAAQYTIMPLTAWLVSLAFDDPRLRVGIILVGCMPGAMASNIMTVLFRGDLILSVTMTSIATLLCPLVIAVWLPLLAGTRMDVAVTSLVWNATWMVVLPVITGIVLRQLKRSVPTWWDRAATALASAAIVLSVLVIVAANRDHLGSIGPALVAAMIVLNLAGYTLAFAVATAWRWPPPQRRTLVIEVGMQNAGLGSVLALAHLGAIGALPSAFYTVLCLFTAAMALPVANRRNAT